MLALKNTVVDAIENLYSEDNVASYVEAVTPHKYIEDSRVKLVVSEIVSEIVNNPYYEAEAVSAVMKDLLSYIEPIATLESGYLYHKESFPVIKLGDELQILEETFEDSDIEAIEAELDVGLCSGHFGTFITDTSGFYIKLDFYDAIAEYLEDWIYDNVKPELDVDEALDMYDELLNDCNDEVRIGGCTYSPSDVLKQVDPTAYRCGFNDYCNELEVEYYLPFNQ